MFRKHEVQTPPAHGPLVWSEGHREEPQLLCSDQGHNVGGLRGLRGLECQHSPQRGLSLPQRGRAPASPRERCSPPLDLRRRLLGGNHHAG